MGFNFNANRGGGGALLAVLLVHARAIDQNVILKRRNVASKGCVEDVWFAFEALLRKRERLGLEGYSVQSEARHNVDGRGLRTVPFCYSSNLWAKTCDFCAN